MITAQQTAQLAALWAEWIAAHTTGCSAGRCSAYCKAGGTPGLPKALRGTPQHSQPFCQRRMLCCWLRSLLDNFHEADVTAGLRLR